MIPANETFSGTFPYQPHFNSAAGFQMHYVDEGPAQAPIVLCLHGEPTWSYLFRHLISNLADRYRVIAPDHMGFGKSETPQARRYLLQDHIDNLEKLVLSLDLKGITLVLHDFGGPMGMALAARHPDRIARIISVNGPTPFGQPDIMERLTANAAHAPWFQWILKAESEGRLETALGELGFNILSTLKINGFERMEVITDSWIRAYGSRFANPSDCLGPIGWAKGFAHGSHAFEAPDDAAKREIQKKPALAIWGMEDRTLGADHFLPLFESLFPTAAIYRLPGAGHYSFEDAPGPIAAIIGAFLAQTDKCPA